MPSEAVHLAIAGLIGAALLADEFDVRALLVVLAAAAFPDLDTFLGIVVHGTHRAALHTVFVALAAAALIAYDTRFRDRSRSWLRRRGPRAVRLAWVSVAVYLLAGVAPDLFYNGVNLFYPLHDRFYSISGQVLVSDQRGIVQTLWQPATSVRGTTATTHYATGVDARPGPDPADAERMFPIANSGLQVLLILTSIVVVTARLWMNANGITHERQAGSRENQTVRSRE